MPDDKSLGTDIFISKSNFGKARNGHKVLVQITKYPEKGRNAEEKIIEVLGDPNQDRKKKLWTELSISRP